MDIMIKINNTQNYKDKLVCEGVLKMVDSKPIVISESEKIEKSDWVYDTLTKNLFQVHNTYTDTCVKVLALPEHFLPKQLQDIVDGKLKEGKCVVGCIEEIAEGTHYGISGFDEPPTECFIKLNPHITIYPVEEDKKFTLDEVIYLIDNASSNWHKCYTNNDKKEHILKLISLKTKQ